MKNSHSFDSTDLIELSYNRSHQIARREQTHTLKALIASLRSAPHRLVALSRKLMQTLLREQRRRATIRELAALDDHALRDIGLNRSQIRTLAEGMISAENLNAERERAATARQPNAVPANASSMEHPASLVVTAGMPASNDSRSDLAA